MKKILYYNRVPDNATLKEIRSDIDLRKEFLRKP